MSYFRTIAFPDSSNFDAFSRLRVADSYNQGDWTNEYAPATFNNQQMWESTTAGSGSITALANQCAVRLSTGGTTNANAATIQTKRHFRYQPGKSRLVLMTFACGTAVTNSTFEIGYGDAENGIFFQRADSTLQFVVRTKTSGSVAETAVAQASWNLDTMNGSGPSGLTLDVTKAQILVMDLQFLGVGRVRVGFDIGGQIIYVHQFLNANNTLSTVYMSTATLPLRIKVVNTDTSSGTLTADSICASVISENGFDDTGDRQFAADNGVTAISTTTTLKPLISIRPVTTFNGRTFRGHLRPASASAIVGSQIHNIQVVRNATLTGPSFAAVNSTYSAAEVDVAASAMSGGIVIASLYVVAGGSGANAFATVQGTGTFDLNPLVYTSLLNTQETLTIGARTVTSTGTAYAAILWDESY